MKKKIFYTAAVLAAAMLLTAWYAGISPDSLAENKDGIKWYSYDDGIKELKKSSRKGFLHFYTDWCGYCRKMEDETFSDSEVISTVNSEFIPIKIDAEDQPGIAKEFDARQFPSNFFVDRENDPIGSQPGFIPPDMMVNLLDYVATDDYKTMEFEEFMDERR
ncbi:MAG: thioredoxin family protein [Desulfosalsimonas sp.]